MKITCTVTRYEWDDKTNAYNDVTQAEEARAYVDIGHDGKLWIYLSLGAASISQANTREAIERGRWLAQDGTKPVCIDGRWGGRNYPEIWVEGNELARIAKEFFE